MKKNIWIWIVRPLMMVIEFPIVFIGTLFLMISNVFMKIQEYISKINIKCREYFIPPRNYILQIFGKDGLLYTDDDGSGENYNRYEEIPN